MRKRSAVSNYKGTGSMVLQILGTALATASLLLPAKISAISSTEPAQSLIFGGTATGTDDLVRASLQMPGTTSPAPINVGSTSFTIEWEMRAEAADNREEAVPCGPNQDWMLGDVLIDRSRGSQGRTFGASIAGGAVVFGVTDASNSQRSICGSQSVTDGHWHHVALEFRAYDGSMSVWVDGRLDASGTGPASSISYPADAIPNSSCHGLPCTSDPYIYFGSTKGTASYSYRGFLSEIRVSDTLRYAGSFIPERARFVPDEHTVALFHLDDPRGKVVHDSSHAQGSQDGERLPDTQGRPQGNAESPFVSSSSPLTQSPSARSSPGRPNSSGMPVGADAAPTLEPSQTHSSLLIPSNAPASQPSRRNQARGQHPVDIKHGGGPGTSLPPVLIALLVLGIAIALASKLLREDRL